MSSLNKVQIIGNLGKTPESKYTPSGKKVTTVTVAVGSKWTGTDGQKHEETEWFNIELWGGSADFAEQYANKGDSVYVEGRLKTEKFDDKDGVTKYFTKVVASNFQLLSSKNTSANATKQSQPSPEVPDDDTIPF